jgi:Nuclease-related domain
MPDIEIYIGSPIEYASERAVLERLAELLSKEERDTIILANIHLSGRRIDLVLALEGLTLVIEAKSSASPLRGGTNGRWEVRVASGGWKHIDNHYRQTLGAAYALRDAMNRFDSAHIGYPRAALIIVPAIPPGSEICQSDYKVSVAGLDGVETLLGTTKQGHWTLDQWRRFAAHHCLTRVADREAAFDPQLAAAEDLIDRYITSFRRTYGPLAAELIPFGCTIEDEPVSSGHIVDQGAAGASMLLRGPSGCGKTLLAYHIGLAAAERGRVRYLSARRISAGAFAMRYTMRRRFLMHGLVKYSSVPANAWGGQSR